MLAGPDRSRIGVDIRGAARPPGPGVDGPAIVEEYRFGTGGRVHVDARRTLAAEPA
jgi:hypothetical protein